MLFRIADSRLANASLVKESHMTKQDLRGRKIPPQVGGAVVFALFVLGEDL